MSRTKVSAEPVLKDWNEVNDALREIGMIERQVAFAEARMNERIDALKSKYDGEAAPTQARKLRLEKDIEEFCIANKTDFERTRTKYFLFGEVSFRLVRTLKPQGRWTWARVLEHLKNFGQRGADYIRIAESVDRDSLRDLAIAGEDMTDLGVRLATTDQFGYKINTESLDEQASKT